MQIPQPNGVIIAGGGTGYMMIRTSAVPDHRVGSWSGGVSAGVATVELPPVWTAKPDNGLWFAQ